jgi:hypothetical protein
VKRSGREQPIWVVIHICMVTTLGIFLYSYLYLKLAKMLVLIISYVFSSRKLENKRAEQVLPRSGDGGGGKVVHIMYTHVSRFKNDKINFFK